MWYVLYVLIVHMHVVDGAVLLGSAYTVVHCDCCSPILQLLDNIENKMKGTLVEVCSHIVIYTYYLAYT